MTPDIDVRRGAIGDAPIIVNFNQRMASETEGLDLPLEQLTPGVLSVLAGRSGAEYFVAEIESQVVGQLMVTQEWSDWRNGEIWWIQSVYVAPEWRRRGVFTALFEHVVGEGSHLGAVGFRLYVASGNEHAELVYRKLGFQRSPYVMMHHCPEATRVTRRRVGIQLPAP
jgi:GNAT superfamily N-acetyltransferase